MKKGKEPKRAQKEVLGFLDFPDNFKQELENICAPSKKENKIDLVFPYTVKPVIYGSLAANMSKVPVISLITGLGFAFTGLALFRRFA